MIPKGWEDRTIGELINFSGGSQPPKNTFSFEPLDGYIRLIQIRDYKTDKYATYVPKNLAKKFCNSEDIMIGRYGPPIFQILRGINGAYNVALIKATPNKKLMREYMYYFLSQDCLQEFITGLSQRTSGQTGIEMDQLKSYPLPLPPLLEQCKIAEMLGFWDESIDLMEKLIGRVRSRKQGLMQQLLTGKKRFKEFEGSEFSVKLLGEIAVTFSGGTPSRTNPEYYNGDIHWIKSGELNLKNIWSTEEKITEEALKNSSAKIVSPDTILIAMYGATAGVIGISRIRAAINQAILAIVPNDSCANDYLFYFLQYSMIEVIKKVQGGQPNLNAQIIRSSSIRLPSLPEQEKIAAVLSTADEEISTLEKQLAAYKQQKLGLMQQLLTGKIRVEIN